MAAHLAPDGWGLQTTVFPAAIIMMALHPSVGIECVTGVMMPRTPHGACSVTVSPWSPLTASLVIISMPGTFSPTRISFSIL